MRYHNEPEPLDDAAREEWYRAMRESNKKQVMKKYRVTVSYKGQATVDVEAPNEVAAEEIAIRKADECINANLHVMDVSMQSFGAHAEVA